MNLLISTPPEWIELALREFNTVLIDHAHCEKKAAANALSLLQAYPDIPGLPALMARLAREESAHLARVLQIMEERGLTLSRDPGDPYAQALLVNVRNGFNERRLDRLLVAGIIEARSHERLQLLSDGLTDEKLKRFYAELATSEDGHTKLFERLALAVESETNVNLRLDELLKFEAKLIQDMPIRAAIH